MRLARILSTIVVARAIAPEYLGVAAIALAVNEIAHVFVRNATNAKIIQAEQSELAALSDTAYAVNWAFGILIFIFQCLVGYCLSYVYNDNSIFLLVSVLGLSYLLLPIAQVHCALNLRKERIGLIAKTEIQQTVLDAALTVGMVFTGFGLWALILPKLLVVPVWIRAHRKASEWVAPKKLSFNQFSEHLKFNSGVLGVELLGVVRHNIDYILVGYFLGMEALGVYYFAFNAGLGLTRGFIISFNNAFYPYLCSVRQQASEIEKRFSRGLGYMLLVIVPLLVLQAGVAEYYVPILFGEQWQEHNASQLVALICLGGVPLLVIEAGSKYIRALGNPTADLKWHVVYSLLFCVAIVVGVQWGLIGVVLAGLVVQFIGAPMHYQFIVRTQENKIEMDATTEIRGFAS